MTLAFVPLPLACCGVRGSWGRSGFFSLLGCPQVLTGSGCWWPVLMGRALCPLAVSATPGSPWSGVEGADGPTIRPPTGPLSVALGTEGLVSTRRRASRWLALSGFGGPVWGLRGQCWWGQSVGGALPQHSPQVLDRKRVSRADGKETALPFGEKWRIPSGPADRAVSPPPSPRRLLLLVFLRMTRQSGQ